MRFYVETSENNSLDKVTGKNFKLDIFSTKSLLKDHGMIKNYSTVRSLIVA